MTVAIMNTTEALTPAQEIGQQLFLDFVSYIDRTQQTAKTYINNLRQFMAWLRFSAIRQPSRQDIINYRDWLSVQHDAIELAQTAAGWKYRTDRSGNRRSIVCKVSTIRGYLQSVKAFFCWTAANNLYPNIAANIHAPKITDTHKKDALTAAEVQSVEQAISLQAQRRRAEASIAAKDAAGKLQRSTEQGARLFAMYLLAVNAGLRTIEISRANVGDLETKGGQAWLYVWGKGHSEPDKKKAIAPQVASAILNYLQLRTDKPTSSSPLFVSTGNRSGGKRIAATTISKMLKGALRIAGLCSPRLTAHSLRHTAGRAVMEITGDNIYKTQQYMRHSNPKTTEIYLDKNTTAQDEKMAIMLFSHYHGKGMEAEATATIQEALQTFSPEKLEQLAAIVQAMA